MKAITKQVWFLFINLENSGRSVSIVCADLLGLSDFVSAVFYVGRAMPKKVMKRLLEAASTKKKDKGSRK